MKRVETVLWGGDILYSRDVPRNLIQFRRRRLRSSTRFLLRASGEKPKPEEDVCRLVEIETALGAMGVSDFPISPKAFPRRMFLELVDDRKRLGDQCV
jgi:hypothetical protein